MVNFNWVDILIGCIIVRTVYVGRKSGLVPEIFKLIGVFCATFITLHYFVDFGNYLGNRLFFSDGVKEIVAFGLLAFSISLIFTLIREGWLIILKIEPPSFVDKWSGVVLSLIRAYLICGLVWLGLLVAGGKGIVRTTRTSLSSSFFKNTSSNIYKSCYSGFISNLFPHEPINKDVFNIVSGTRKKPGKKSAKKSRRR